MGVRPGDQRVGATRERHLPHPLHRGHAGPRGPRWQPVDPRRPRSLLAEQQHVPAPGIDHQRLRIVRSIGIHRPQRLGLHPFAPLDQLRLGDTVNHHLGPLLLVVPDVPHVEARPGRAGAQRQVFPVHRLRSHQLVLPHRRPLQIHGEHPRTIPRVVVRVEHPGPRPARRQPRQLRQRGHLELRLTYGISIFNAGSAGASRGGRPGGRRRGVEGGGVRGAAGEGQRDEGESEGSHRDTLARPAHRGILGTKEGGAGARQGAAQGATLAA